jgi:hypothetical protein
MSGVNTKVERPPNVVIFTRRGSGDCYVAKAQGLGVTASCTDSPARAAERCALKVKTGRKDVVGLTIETEGIELRCETAGDFGACTFSARWEGAAA